MKRDLGSGLLYVHVAEVVEVRSECLRAISLENCTESKLSLCRVPYLLIFYCILVLELRSMVVLLEVNLNEFVYCLVLYLLEVSHNCAERNIVNMVAETHLSLYLVTVCNGYIVHLVAETEDSHVL